MCACMYFIGQHWPHILTPLSRVRAVLFWSVAEKLAKKERAVVKKKNAACRRVPNSNGICHKWAVKQNQATGVTTILSLHVPLSQTYSRLSSAVKTLTTGISPSQQVELLLRALLWYEYWFYWRNFVFDKRENCLNTAESFDPLKTFRELQFAFGVLHSCDRDVWR